MTPRLWVWCATAVAVVVAGLPVAAVQPMFRARVEGVRLDVLVTQGSVPLAGLGAADFVRVSTVQRVSRPGFRRIARAGITLAEAEGLSAHAQSLRVRLGGSEPTGTIER